MADDSVREPLLELVPDPISTRHRQRFSKFKCLPSSPWTQVLFVSSVFTSLSCFLFFCTVATGHFVLPLNPKTPENGSNNPVAPNPSPNGEYVAAILAGILYSTSTQLFVAVRSYFSRTRISSESNSHQRGTIFLFRVQWSEQKNAIRFGVLNLIIGGPVYIGASAHFLKSQFPDIELMDAVVHFLVAVPFMAMAVFLLFGWAESIRAKK
ncbi:hypothetical protein DL96DRAFT_1819833 [Flagelloscypha sp. PMI_526]|nr:hypothetical protein DL96DRAFT_1819833 [Flagelloscypha sp. PMI_526]